MSRGKLRLEVDLDSFCMILLMGCLVVLKSRESKYIIAHFGKSDYLSLVYLLLHTLRKRLQYNHGARERKESH